MYPFVVEHAGGLLTRYNMYDDGRTAYEWTTGRKSSPPMCAIGEIVLFWPLKAARNRRWRYGVFLGIIGKSGEYVIGSVCWNVNTNEQS